MSDGVFTTQLNHDQSLVGPDQIADGKATFHELRSESGVFSLRLDKQGYLRLWMDGNDVNPIWSAVLPTAPVQNSRLYLASSAILLDVGDLSQGNHVWSGGAYGPYPLETLCLLIDYSGHVLVHSNGTTVWCAGIYFGSSALSVTNQSYTVEGTPRPLETLFDSGPLTIPNRSNGTISQSFNYTKEEGTTLSLAVGAGVSLGVSVEFSGGVPGIAQGKTTVTGEVSFTVTAGVERTVAESYSTQFTVEVPPMTTVVVDTQLVKMATTFNWVGDGTWSFTGFSSWGTTADRIWANNWWGGGYAPKAPVRTVTGQMSRISEQWMQTMEDR